MDAEAAVNALLEADVLAETGGQLRVTDTFEATVERRKTAMSDAATATTLREMTGRDESAMDGSDVTDGDRLFAGYFEALRDEGEFDADADFDLDGAHRPAALTTVDCVRRGEPPAEGVPDEFLPVHGDALSPLLRFSRWAIVYVWREECPPCEIMREELSRAVDTSHEGLSRFAVFGPDWSETLQKQFDVVGGPTTLLVLDGTVDLRLAGTYSADQIERETETLLEL